MLNQREWGEIMHASRARILMNQNVHNKYRERERELICVFVCGNEEIDDAKSELYCNVN